MNRLGCSGEHDELDSAMLSYCWQTVPVFETTHWQLEAANVCGSGHDAYVEDRICQITSEFAQGWTCFGRGFEPDMLGCDLYTQLRRAGISDVAASILKLDPSPGELVGTIRNGLQHRLRRLRPEKFETRIKDCVFWDRDRPEHGDDNSCLLTVLDVFDPHWKPPLSVSVHVRRLIVEQLRMILSQWEAMELGQLTNIMQMRYQEGAISRNLQAERVKDVVAELERALTKATRMQVHLTPYGSTTYGLSDENSDLDCTVAVDTCDPQIAFGLLHDAFSKLGDWRVLPTCMKFLIQVVNVTTWPGFEVDLKVSPDRLGNENSELFGKLIRSDCRVAPLLVFLKQELRVRGLIQPPEKFSSYAYMTMILSVLTDLHVVPPLRRDIGDLVPQWVSGCNIAHHECEAGWASSNHMALGELVLKVLHEMVTPNRVFSLTWPQELYFQDTALTTAACTVAASADCLFICDLDDTLVRTSVHCKDRSLDIMRTCDSLESLPLSCIQEVVAILHEKKRDGWFIAIVTGRSNKLYEGVADILLANGVPFDGLYCKPETCKTTTARYKADTVSALTSQTRIQNITLVDDSVEFLDAMLQALPEHKVEAFLAMDGNLVPYTLKQAAVVLCACPMTLQERALLERICNHFDAVSVDIDALDVETTETGEKLGTNMGVAGPLITSMLVVDGKQLVFVISAAYRSKIRELSAYLPFWTTLILLRPLKDPLAACWSMLQEIAQREELEHRRKSLPPSQQEIRVLDEAMFEEGLQQLSADQHRNLHTVFNKLEVDCKRCCEVAAGQITSHRTIDIQLHSFVPSPVGGIPKEIQTITQFIRKAKQAPEEKINQRIYQALQDLVCRRGYFASLQRDAEAAFGEIVQKLERVVCKPN